MRIRANSFSRIVGIGAFLAAGFALLAWLCPPAAAQIRDSMERVAEKMAPRAGMAEEEAPADRPLVSPDANLEITEKDRGIPKLLMSEEEMRALLGKDPDFIYDPAGRDDPMLIPWIQARVIAQEYERIAEDAIAGRDYEKAGQAYMTILRLLDQVDSPWIRMKTFDEIRTRATAGLASVQRLKMTAGPGMVGDEGPLGAGELPAWIRNNTTAIILNPNDPVCLVGPFPLHVGDEVPGQAVKVVVEKIERNAVHYKVGNNTVMVEVGKGAVPPDMPSPSPRRGRRR